MNRKIRRRLLWTAALVALALWLLWGNWAVTVSAYSVTLPGLPAGFDGFRIAQVSDLHNAEFGPGNARLLEKLRASAPDLIVLTGDLADSVHTDLDVAISFARAAVEIAPTYFVTGNHEARLADYAALRDGLQSAGVTVLEDQAVTLTQGTDRVVLYGLRDPAFGPSPTLPETEEFLILLAHRPEYFERYAAQGADLVLSGHAHGGQVRLPFLGGLFAPGQGFFPKYDAGLYREFGTVMVVSRGLGNSIIPLRVNDPPELVIMTLHTT